MDTEDKRRLVRALELSEENNKILKKMLRTMRWARLVRIVYWLVIIGVSVGALYFFQPYIDQLREVYGGIKGTVDSVNGFFD